MNTKAFFLFLVLISNIILGQTAFENGYLKGYKKGYCYNQYGCIVPKISVLPSPSINEYSYSFEDGFLRGFYDGQKSNSNPELDEYNQINYRKLDNDLRLIKYQKPTSSFNFELINQVLQYKQKQYDKRVADLESKRLNYKNQLNEFISFSYSLHNGLLELIKPNSSDFGQIDDLEIYLKNNTPQKIVKKYPQTITKKQADQLIKELAVYNSQIKSWTGMVNEELQFFKDHPNTIISGVFKVNSIIDYEYNENSGNYDPINEVLSPSYIKFEKNYVLFKRGDNKKTKRNALRYWGIKDGLHIFYDGRNQLLAIDKQFSYINWYYEDNLQGQFLKKSFYSNLEKPR